MINMGNGLVAVHIMDIMDAFWYVLLSGPKECS